MADAKVKANARGNVRASTKVLFIALQFVN
jgi:hypothetical protein